jgi:hypothetical protein
MTMSATELFHFLNMLIELEPVTEVPGIWRSIRLLLMLLGLLLSPELEVRFFASTSYILTKNSTQKKCRNTGHMNAAKFGGSHGEGKKIVFLREKRVLREVFGHRREEMAGRIEQCDSSSNFFVYELLQAGF